MLGKIIGTAASFAAIPLLMPFVDGDPKAVTRFAMKHRAIAPWQIPSEFEAFAKIVAERRPKSILEIGTLHGGMLFVLCRLADPSATIISSDLTETFSRHNRRPLMRLFPRNGQSLHLLRADSHAASTLAQVGKLLSEPLDLLFIDGDHSYGGARKDFEMYGPLVSSGGLIAFHDIVEHHDKNHCDVMRLWDELKPRYRYQELIEDPKQDRCGIGILYV